MLHIFPTQGSYKTGEPGVVATSILWPDLLNPTSAEIANVEERSARRCHPWGA
jgi:hypothetical protein